MPLNDAIQSLGLICVPLDAVLNLFWSISHKVVCLSLHGTYPSLQPPDQYNPRDE